MSNMITVKKVVIKGLTSLDRICKIAKERGCTKSEVFVRVHFVHGSKEYAVSQRMMYLGTDDYLTLLDAMENDKVLDLDVDPKSGFFNIHKEISKEDRLAKLEEIMADKPVSTVKTQADLTDLL